MCITLWALLVLFCNCARANVLEIFPGQSITEAVQMVSQGDTVLLTPGEYREFVRVREFGVTICSNFLFSGDTSDIRSTVIIADTLDIDSASCLFIYLPNEQDSVVLVGLSFANGRGTRWISDEVVSSAGGGVFAYRSRVRVSHCLFSECSAGAGGGASVVHEVPGVRGIFGVFRNCKFWNCWSPGPQGGGGMYALSNAIVLNNVCFEACSSQTAGGYMGFGVQTTMIGCTLRSCGSTMGAAFVGSALESTVEACVFDGNGIPGQGGYRGECHLFTGGQVRVRHNIFQNNASSDVALTMIDFDRYGTSFLEGNVFESHTMGPRSGAFYFWDCEGDISYNVFRNCSSEYGASLVPGGRGIVRIHHNIFAGNSQGQNGFGSVINYINAGSIPARCDSNIFEGNVGPVISYDENSPHPQSIFAQSNWWGDSSGPYHPTRNPNGQGDTLLSDIIVFDPWLTVRPDTSQSISVPDNDNLASLSTWELLPIYPNPFNNRFTVSIAGFTREDFEISMFDLLGRKVSDLYKGRLSTQSFMVSVPESLGSGVYFILAKDKLQTCSKKVLFLK